MRNFAPVDRREEEGGNVKVLYRCECGQYGKLSEMYYSEPCKKLVCQRSSCCLIEIESYYCGFQLDNMPSQEAAIYHNKSSNSFQCPDCQTVLNTLSTSSLPDESCQSTLNLTISHFYSNHTVEADSADLDSKKCYYYFECSYCHWDSFAIGLYDDQPDLLVMSAITQEREAYYNENYSQLLAYYKNKYQAFFYSGKISSNRRSTNPNLLQSINTRDSVSQSEGDLLPWRWIDVEKKRQTIENRLFESVKVPMATHHKDVDIDSELINQTDMNQISSLSQRFNNLADQSRTRKKIYPNRLKLRAKKSKRCIEAIVDKHNPGILVKPQINPMTGDSSVPIMASWWKKATLAIHYLPIVTIQKLPFIVDATAKDSKLEYWLLIVNPLDYSISVQLESAVENDGYSVKSELDNCKFSIGAAEDPHLCESFEDSTESRESQEVQANSDSSFIVTSKRNFAIVKIRALRTTSDKNLRTNILISTRIMNELSDDDIDSHTETCRLGELCSMNIALWLGEATTAIQ